MTSNTRASIFETTEEELDLSAFKPKTAPDPTAPSPEKVRAVAEKANFRSREPISKVAPPIPTATSPQPTQTAIAQRPPQRRYRTGRNVPLNIKATAATAALLTAISEANGWVLGETLERALAALQREQGRGE